MKVKIKIILLVLAFVLSIALTVTACSFGGDDDVVTDAPSNNGTVADDDQDDSPQDDYVPEAPPGEYFIYANLSFNNCDHMATPGIYAYFIKVMSDTEVTITLTDSNIVFLGAFIEDEMVSDHDGFTITMPRDDVYITFEYESYLEGMEFSYDSTIDGYVLVSPHDKLNSEGDLIIPNVYNDGVNGVKEVKVISDGVFQGKTDIKRVREGENIVKIGDNAFKDCVNLKVVSIGDKTTYLGDMAFYNTSASGIIEIQSTLEYFGEGAFGRTKINGFYTNDKLENFVIIDKALCVEENGVYTMLCSPKTATDDSLYEIPVEVSVLAPYALSGASFEKIGFEDSGNGWYGNENFTSIGEYAFAYTNVRTIELPSTITTMEAYSFYRSNVINFYMTQLYQVTHIYEYAFADCYNLDKEMLTGSHESTNYGIKDSNTGHFRFFTGLEYIGEYAFLNCYGLEFTNDVEFNGGEVEIGDYAFSGTGVTGITICNMDCSKVSNLAFANTPLNYLKMKLHYDEGLVFADVFAYFTMNKGMATLFGGKEIYRIDFVDEDKEDLDAGIALAKESSNFADNFICFSHGGDEDSDYYECYMAKVLSAEFYTARVESSYNVYENTYIKQNYQISETDETIAVLK